METTLIQTMNEMLREDKAILREHELVIHMQDHPRCIQTGLRQICWERDYCYDKKHEFILRTFVRNT